MFYNQTILSGHFVNENTNANNPVFFPDYARCKRHWSNVLLDWRRSVLWGWLSGSWLHMWYVTTLLWFMHLLQWFIWFMS